jgi:hypothetical protein
MAIQKAFESKPRNDKRQPQQVFATSDDSPMKEAAETKRTCVFCDRASHEVKGCRSFGKKTVEERWTWAKDKNACLIASGLDTGLRNVEVGHPVEKMDAQNPITLFFILAESRTHPRNQPM